LSLGNDRSTGPLKNHMSSQHTKQYNDEQKANDYGSIDRFTVGTKGNQDPWGVTLKWIVLNDQPFSIVENEYFHNMLHEHGSKAPNTSRREMMDKVTLILSLTLIQTLTLTLTLFVIGTCFIRAV